MDYKNYKNVQYTQIEKEKPNDLFKNVQIQKHDMTKLNPNYGDIDIGLSNNKKAQDKKKSISKAIDTNLYESDTYNEVFFNGKDVNSLSNWKQKLEIEIQETSWKFNQLKEKLANENAKDRLDDIEIDTENYFNDKLDKNNPKTHRDASVGRDSAEDIDCDREFSKDSRGRSVKKYNPYGDLNRNYLHHYK